MGENTSELDKETMGLKRFRTAVLILAHQVALFELSFLRVQERELPAVS